MRVMKMVDGTAKTLETLNGLAVQVARLRSCTAGDHSHLVQPPHQSLVQTHGALPLVSRQVRRLSDIRVRNPLEGNR